VYHAYASEMHNLISPLVYQRAQVAPALNRDRSHCVPVVISDYNDHLLGQSVIRQPHFEKIRLYDETSEKMLNVNVAVGTLLCALPEGGPLSFALCLSVCPSVKRLRFSRNWKAVETSN